MSAAQPKAFVGGSFACRGYAHRYMFHTKSHAQTDMHFRKDPQSVNCVAHNPDPTFSLFVDRKQTNHGFFHSIFPLAPLLTPCYRPHSLGTLQRDHSSKQQLPMLQLPPTLPTQSLPSYLFGLQSNNPTPPR